MIEHLLHPRITESKIGQHFYICLCYNHIPNQFENRFGDFMNLFSDKYNKVYRDGSHLKKALLTFHFFCTGYFICLFQLH
jgi:hypothetical protein